MCISGRILCCWHFTQTIGKSLLINSSDSSHTSLIVQYSLNLLFYCIASGIGIITLVADSNASKLLAYYRLLRSKGDDDENGSGDGSGDGSDGGCFRGGVDDNDDDDEENMDVDV